MEIKERVSGKLRKLNKYLNLFDKLMKIKHEKKKNYYFFPLFRTFKTGCPASFSVGLSEDLQRLEIISIDFEHATHEGAEVINIINVYN